MGNPTKPKQLPALTGLRGIAAICIVLHHYTVYLYPATGNYVKQFTPFIIKSYLWVDFFFILSGFVLAHVYTHTFSNQINRKEYIAFLRARLARIYPLHIITLLFLILFEFAKLYLHQEYGVGDFKHPPFTGKHSIDSIFTNIFLLQAFHEWSYWNEPAWAISAEWMLYLAVPLLIYLSKGSNRLVDIGVVFVGLLTLYLLASRNNGLDFVSWRSLVRCSAEGTIGILAYKLIYRQMPVRIFCKSWFTSLVLVCCLTTMAVQTNHVVTVTLFVLLIISAAKLHTHLLLTSRSLLFLGTISYSIYMTHWCIRDVLQEISFILTGQNVSANIQGSLQGWLLPVTIAFTVLMSAGCYSWIEQPLRERINKHPSRSARNSRKYGEG